MPASTVIYDMFAGSGVVAKKLLNGNIAPENVHVNDIDKTVTDKYFIPGTTVSNLPAVDILKSLVANGSGKETFVFIDPPYLHETCRSKNNYTHEMTAGDHLMLLLHVRDLKCNTMVIHPVCALYDTMLSNFRQIEVKVRYHQKNIH